MVLQQIANIQSMEQHFNTLEMNYRRLASYWLLSALIGTGYIAAHQDNIQNMGYLLIIVLCGLSSIGIGLLWHLDANVYHRLLLKVFIEGMKLEFNYGNWLPPIRIKMIHKPNPSIMPETVKHYYFFVICVLVIVAEFAFFLFIKENGSSLQLYAMLTISTALILIAVHCIMKIDKSNDILIESIRGEYVKKYPDQCNKNAEKK